MVNIILATDGSMTGRLFVPEVVRLPLAKTG